MGRILAIASVTLKEALRNKILYTIVFFAVALVGSSTVLETVFIGERGKIIVDVGLGALELLGLFVAVFVGIGLIQVEMEKKTIYFVLSKPVKRHQFILGKYLGLAATLLILTVLMSIVFLLTCAGFRVNIEPMLLIAIGFIYLKFLVVVAITMFFTSFSGPIMSGIFVLALYAIGHMGEDIRELGIVLDNPALSGVFEILYRVLPNLNYFDYKTNAVYHLAVDNTQLEYSAIIGVLYVAVLLTLSCLAFQRKEFK
jgi:ABC-type transport system involved in multi-copper enzyme maturation permease subunit